MRRLRMSAWTGVGGMVLVSALVMGLGWANAAEMQEPSNGPVNHIGTFVAASHDMDTVVVDVPLDDSVLRVGAAVTDDTKLLEDGSALGWRSSIGGTACACSSSVCRRATSPSCWSASRRASSGRTHGA